MGNKPSMEDELINLKLSSKQMVMASKKCEKNHQKQLKAVEKAIKQGNREGAQIYAQNAIREKTQGMNYLRLSSRLDAVGARLETAVRTKQVSFLSKIPRARLHAPHCSIL
jgi:charged multivesicular body protein 1